MEKDLFADLDAYLARTMASQKERRKRQQAIKMADRRAAPIKTQAELEWTTGKTVCLIHRSPDGAETALGLFIEHLRGTSRWLRPTAESLSPDHQEYVSGPWWIHPQIREIPVDSSHEVAAIRARFEMLLSDFVEDYNLPPPSASMLETVPGELPDDDNDDEFDPVETDDEDEDLDDEDDEDDDEDDYDEDDE